MKDIEKIKSEDLGCQVADANPGNFAIEQEVAQLVGATVPAPTEPSADDARELGAQLLVFLRRALLPIRSALRTAVAAIYAHLDSRCTDYTPAAYAPYIPRPYDPMSTPPTPRTVANLLTAITAFSARKISAGESDVPDGLSMMHFLGDSSVNSAITKIGDDNTGWTCDRAIALPVPVSELTINCVKANGADVIASTTDAETLILPHLESTESADYSGVIADNSHVKHLVMPEFKECKSGRWTRVATRCSALETIDMPKSEVLSGFSTYYGGANINSCASLWYVRMGKLRSFNSMWYVDCPKIIHLEICGSGGYQENNISFSSWNPSYVLSNNPTGNDLVTDEGISTNLDQFLQNFREHIALRLTSNGSGLTLTLSQAVRDAIHAAEATYGIEAIIVTQKGWTLSPAPGASSQ